ncbi:MAG: hypothetical protein ACOCXH_04010 [Cyclobacteriaceae bacterium]
MSKYAFTVSFIFSVLIGYAQSADELDKKNGFQDITMLSSPRNNIKLEYVKDVAHERVPLSQVQYYQAAKREYKKIGSVNIKSLEVWAYKDQIFQIRVVTEQDPDLYKGLRQLFGTPDYSIREDLYYWSGKKVRLSYQAESKSRLELIYFSHLLDDILKSEKNEEIDNIADDF